MSAIGGKAGMTRSLRLQAVILGLRAKPMRRREFVKVIAGVIVAWPLATLAQQPAMPVIGYLNYGSPESDAFRLTGLCLSFSWRSPG